jgi:hypothetical protein
MGNANNIHDPSDDKFYYCPTDDCPCNGSSTHRDDYWRTPVDDNLAAYYDSDDYHPDYINAYRDHLRTP